MRARPWSPWTVGRARRPGHREDPRGAARRRRGGAPRWRRASWPPAPPPSASTRARRRSSTAAAPTTRVTLALAARAGRAGDRLRRRGRPGRGAAAARRRRRRRHGGARRPGRAVGLRRGAQGAAAPPPDERLARRAPLRRRGASPTWAPRAVGHLRQFWPRFRRHGALDKPLSLRAHGGRATRPTDRAPAAASDARSIDGDPARLRKRRECPILACHFGTRPRTGPRCRVEEEESVVDREIILTPEGYQRLKEEIEYLSTVKRDEVAERIRAARDFGDISENSEYDDAKNEQAMLEARIFALEEQALRGAIVIDSDSITTDVVGVGTKVTLQDMQRGDVVQYSIVGSAEADPARAQAVATSRPSAAPSSVTSPATRSPSRVPQGSKTSSRSWTSRRPEPPAVPTSSTPSTATSSPSGVTSSPPGARPAPRIPPASSRATRSRTLHERLRAARGRRRTRPTCAASPAASCRAPRARQAHLRRRSRTLSGELQLFCQLDALGDERYARRSSTSTSATSSAPRAP